MSRITEVRHGSTEYVTEGVGSHASRSTVMGGSAILLAARAFKDKLAAAAAVRLGVAPKRDRVRRRHLGGAGRTDIGFAEFAGGRGGGDVPQR